MVCLFAFGMVSFGLAQGVLFTWSICGWIDKWFGLALFVSEIGSYFVVQVGLELAIFLPRPPECWDSMPVPLCPS